MTYRRSVIETRLESSRTTFRGSGYGMIQYPNTSYRNQATLPLPSSIILRVTAVMNTVVHDSIPCPYRILVIVTYRTPSSFLDYYLVDLLDERVADEILYGRAGALMAAKHAE